MTPPPGLVITHVGSNLLPDWLGVVLTLIATHALAREFKEFRPRPQALYIAGVIAAIGPFVNPFAYRIFLLGEIAELVRHVAVAWLAISVFLQVMYASKRTHFSRGQRAAKIAAGVVVAVFAYGYVMYWLPLHTQLVMPIELVRAGLYLGVLAWSLWIAACEYYWP